MTVERAQVTITTEDNNPANYSTNTVYANILDSTGRDNWVAAIVALYSSIDNYYASTVNQNGHIIKVYDMADPEPRAPILEDTFDFNTNPTSNPLPSEVAVCLSFQAARQSGNPQSRRRGRIYIGPLGVNGLDTSGRPSSAHMTALANAGSAFLAQSVTDGDWAWAVWSTVDQNISFVTNGWVDNSYDTQRRRGLEYTSRTTFD